MLQAGYTAWLGMTSQQERLDVLGNNLANVNTPGFKHSNVTFKETLYETIQRPIQPQEDSNLQRGHGTLVSGIDKIFSQGIATQTGIMTDFCLEGDGFFTVQSPEGGTYYTRDGSFRISSEEDANYLVTGQGYYVLDTNNNRIQIDADPEVNIQGYFSDGDIATEDIQLQIVRFADQKGLDATSDNMFVATEASGEPIETQGLTKVIQGYVEGSNVNLSNEMTKMIRTQRAFSFCARALTTADEMDATANQLR